MQPGYRPTCFKGNFGGKSGGLSCHKGLVKIPRIFLARLSPSPSPMERGKEEVLALSLRAVEGAQRCFPFAEFTLSGANVLRAAAAVLSMTWPVVVGKVHYRGASAARFHHEREINC